ncbi:hypothetical protein SDC9_178301 [bioreactor metagenome]|uniref:Uncharacterized protein n=1 Tax=bioreactor metagenome TaxID=1076179 RepID=A0A645GWU5_9ZZZZ
MKTVEIRIFTDKMIYFVLNRIAFFSVFADAPAKFIALIGFHHTVFTRFFLKAGFDIPIFHVCISAVYI